MSDTNYQISLSKHSLGNERLDRFISTALQVSRSRIKTLILDGHVCVDGMVVSTGSYSVAYQATIQVVMVVLDDMPHQIADVIYEPGKRVSGSGIDVPIVYEDDHVLVIDKPVGLVVHSAPSVTGITLVDLFLFAGVALHHGDDATRAGIVHRLDQYTEGLMVIAKTKAAMLTLQAQFRDRRVLKKYYAVLVGVLTEDHGEINRPIGRDVHIRARQSCHHYVEGTQKDAITQYQVLHRLTNLCVVDVTLITGRTHQIRVHFASKSTPVLGDALYSKQRAREDGYYLQSYALTFDHPITNECMEFTVPMSERLKQYAKH